MLGNPAGSVKCRRNPFRVVNVQYFKPRVARSSQPWAGGRNPFGIVEQSLEIYWGISLGFLVGAPRFEMESGWDSMKPE
jgi:hypothetical protein